MDDDEKTQEKNNTNYNDCKTYKIRMFNHIYLNTNDI